MNNEECIARMQQLSEEMYDLVRELALSDQYQNALDDENRRLIEENRELKKELEILRAKTGRAQDFQIANSSIRNGLMAEAIKLHENKGLSSYEISNIINTPAKTIQTWLRNAKGETEDKIKLNTQSRDQETKLQTAYAFLLASKQKISGRSLAKEAHVSRDVATPWLAKIQGYIEEPELEETEEDNLKTQILQVWNEDKTRSTRLIGSMLGTSNATVSRVLKPYRNSPEQGEEPQDDAS